MLYLSIIWGISPEVHANLIEVANAVSNVLKNGNQLDLSGLLEADSRFNEIRKMVHHSSEITRNLAALISEKLRLYIESANKLANKSANKSADSDIKSANRTSKLTGHQKEILTIMEDGVEYAMEAIAGAIGLKGPRTRQTVIKIELRSKKNTIKSKEGFKEVRKHVHSIG